MSADSGAPEERELAEFLQRLPREPVDPLRREEARAAFLAAGASRASGAARREPTMLSPHDEEAFARWLVRVAPPEPARAERRARARAAYLSGVAQTAPEPRAPSWRRRWLGLALAAAGLLLTFLLPEPTRWKVELFAPVSFEGESFPRADGQRLAVQLEGAGTLVTAGGPARLVLGDALELELRADAELFVPSLPELDGLSQLRFELRSGECYLRTRPGWRGNPLVVATELGDVRAHGTAFGVLLGAGGLCVCVAEGTVEVDNGLGPELVHARHLAEFAGRADPAPTRRAFPSTPNDPLEAHTQPLVGFAEAP